MNEFVPIGKEVEPGDRLLNSDGQILLDPVKSVPAREAWVHENPERLKSILKGIAQIEAGRVVKRPLPVSED